MAHTPRIQIRGRTEVWMEYIADGTGLHFLGETEDGVQESHTVFTHNVPGDRNGGNDGPPMEVQYLGAVINVQLALSRWSSDLARFIENRNILNQGVLNLNQVGMTMLLFRSWRVVLSHRTIDPQTGNLIEGGRNYPCCIVPDPVEQNRGTKYSTLSFTFQAHRAPEFHQYNGTLYDEVNIGVPNQTQTGFAIRR